MSPNSACGAAAVYAGGGGGATKMAQCHLSKKACVMKFFR